MRYRLMECTFCAGQPECDYELEYEVPAVVLDEAKELRMALNAEIDSLRLRIRQLEQYIMDTGITPPPEEL